MRIGIMGSGSGTNMQAIVDAIAAGKIDAQVVLVLADVENAKILERARKYGIAAQYIDCGGAKTAFPLAAQAQAAQLMLNAKVDLICLAGFMRLIKAPLLEPFAGRIINIHPSLLPAFPGLHAWEQALQSGAKVTGCTVHYVDSGMDSGEIILQEQVPVLPDDDAASLHARIQVAEHRTYVAAINKVIAARR